VTGPNVHDAEAPMTETDLLTSPNSSHSRVDENALIVRTAMREHVAHAFQLGRINATPRSGR
jgi:hypothetical protein